MRIFLVILMLSAVMFGSPEQLDLTFGSDGMVITDIGNDDHWYKAVATQSDGKIVAVGRYYGTSPNRFGVVARYNNNGSLDFLLTKDEVILTDVEGVAIQSNGKIVITGNYNQDFAMVRFNTNGTLDSSFGNNGLVTTDMDGAGDSAEAILIQRDGRIILAGRATFGNIRFALARYHSDGSLDMSFGINGKVNTEIPGGLSYIKDITLQRDGKIIATGYVGIYTTFDSFALARYFSNGSLDGTFGGTGMVTTSIGNDDAHINAVAVDSHNRIYVAGYTTRSNVSISTTAKYLPDGTLDSSFGNGGILDKEEGRFYDIALVSGGFFVTGYERSPSLINLIVNKYHSDGSADLSWNGSGKAQANFNSHSYGYAIALDSQNKVVVAGRYRISQPSFAVVRFNN